MSGSTRLLAFAAFTFAAICAVLACRYVRLHTAVEPERKPWTELDDKIAAIEGGVATAGSLSVRVDTACCYVPVAESESGVATTDQPDYAPLRVNRYQGPVAIYPKERERLSDEDITRIGHEVARVLAQREAR